jgi:hypothetical protein
MTGWDLGTALLAGLVCAGCVALIETLRNK